jgi:hypothetical protein
VISQLSNQTVCFDDLTFNILETLAILVLGGTGIRLSVHELGLETTALFPADDARRGVVVHDESQRFQDESQRFHDESQRFQDESQRFQDESHSGGSIEDGEREKDL